MKKRAVSKGKRVESKAAKKVAPMLPESWMGFLKGLSVEHAVVYSLVLSVVGAFVGLVGTKAFSAPVDTLIIVVAFTSGITLFSLALGVFFGNWLGNKWGEKAPWPGYAALSAGLNLVGVCAAVLVSFVFPVAAGAGAGLGGVLWAIGFMGYYKTDMKHAIYGFLAINAVALAIMLAFFAVAFLLKAA